MDGNLSFGDLVKSLRKKAGISSTKLSNMLDKGDAYISQIENNRNKNPDYDTCFKLFEILNVEQDKIKDILTHYNIYPQSNSEKAESGDLFSDVIGDLLKIETKEELDRINNYNPTSKPEYLKVLSEGKSKINQLKNHLYHLVELDPFTSQPYLEKIETLTNDLFRDIAKEELKKLMIDESSLKQYKTLLSEATEELESELKSRNTEKDA
jgi:transcriptional regulator with XRE-family HTH domain